jgi:ABC-type sugar transport system substrate-binding protein
MKLAHTRSTTAAATAVLAVLALATACNRESTASTQASGGDKPAIGIDLPRSDSDFWNSYADYVKKDIDKDGIKALPLSNSQNDVTKLVANVQVFENTGAKAVVMAPQDTGAIASTLDALAAKKIPVVSVDPTRATSTWSYAPTTRPTAPRRASSSASSWAARARWQNSRAPWTPSTDATAPKRSPRA